jgi:ferredoxin
MADKTHRLPFNAPGRYYVDDSCIDCDICRQVAPSLFVRNAAAGASYVLRQPETDDEITLAEEALAGCPTETIGSDG